MDIESFKKIANQQILSGKMVDVILLKQKEKEMEAFLARENKKKELEPLFEKLDELGNKFEQASLPSVKDAKISRKDFDSGFTAEDEMILYDLGLEMPNEIWTKGTEDENLELANQLIQDLKYKKRSRNKGLKRDANKKSLVVNRVRNRIKSMQELRDKELDSYIDELLDEKSTSTETLVGSGLRRIVKRGRFLPAALLPGTSYGSGEHSRAATTSRGASVGLLSSLAKLTKGVDFRKVGRQAKIASQIFTSPEDLLHRFKVLGGSIEAGNNNMKIEKEFVNTAHKLRDLGILNNSQLDGIINSLGRRARPQAVRLGVGSWLY